MLSGKGPADVSELVLVQCTLMLQLSGFGTYSEAMEAVRLTSLRNFVQSSFDSYCEAMAAVHFRSLRNFVHSVFGTYPTLSELRALDYSKSLTC